MQCYAFLVHKIPVGVLGASGYAGRELCALIGQHPVFELAFASASAQRGLTLRIGRRDLKFVAPEDAPLGNAELIFSALPHGASLEWVKRARDTGARVVDLSADLRPGNGASDGVPYGLTELMREQNRRWIASGIGTAWLCDLRVRGKWSDRGGIYPACGSSVRRSCRGFPRLLDRQRASPSPGD